jgi:hypothetical protein
LSCNPGQAVLLLPVNTWLFANCDCVFQPAGFTPVKRRNMTGTVCVSEYVMYIMLCGHLLLFSEENMHARNSCCSAFHSSIVQGTQAGVNPRVFTGTASILLEANKRLFRSLAAITAVSHICRGLSRRYYPSFPSSSSTHRFLAYPITIAFMQFHTAQKG